MTFQKIQGTLHVADTIDLIVQTKTCMQYYRLLLLLLFLRSKVNLHTNNVINVLEVYFKGMTNIKFVQAVKGNSSIGTSGANIYLKVRVDTSTSFFFKRLGRLLPEIYFVEKPTLMRFDI